MAPASAASAKWLSKGGPTLDAVDDSETSLMDGSLDFAPQSAGDLMSSVSPAATYYSSDSIKTVNTPRAFAVNVVAKKGTVPEQITEAEIKTSGGILRDAKPLEKKNYEVAAGARIDQEVYADPESVDYWEDEPAGLIYINYADAPYVQQILASGKRDEEQDGFLGDVPVGHKTPEKVNAEA
jgi:hypothetical protein